jgi:hypothetical protein
MMGTEYKEGETVLARHVTASDAWAEGLSFFSDDADFIQCGTWRYSKGKDLLAHRHNIVPRRFDWTQEVLFIWKGSIRARVFDSHNRLVAEFDAREGDIVAMLSGGHGYEVLEDDTRVLEVKNGPYVGADADRVRLSDIR